MKFNRPILVVAFVIIVLLLIEASRTFGQVPAWTTLKWDANDPADKVLAYLVDWRLKGTTNWTTISVPGSNTTVTIGVKYTDAEFRLAASNSFTTSPWTEIVRAPASVVGIKFILEVTP